MEVLSKAIEEAAQRFVESRVLEGEKLKDDLLGKLDYMSELVDFVTGHAPAVVAEYRRRLEERVREFLESASIDEGRIAAEVTIFADKICVDEEMVRLRSHIDAVRRELTAGRERRTEAGFHRSGDEPGGQHDPFQVYGSGDLGQGHRLEDGDREGPGADPEY